MRSSKVNSGDTAAAEQYNNLVDDAFGGSQLLAHQQATPNMTLRVEKGVAYLNNQQITFNGGNSPTFSAPTTNPRIDLLVMDSAGALSIIQGTEAATPSPPTYPTDKLVICEVFLRVGSTAIYDTDQGTNAYIRKDAREFLFKTAAAPVDRQVFSTPGNHTWTKPSQGTIAFVQCWGGGGGGRRAGSGGTGGGGGGGGYAEKWIPLSILGSTVQVTVGAGGAGGASDYTPGSAGGNSSFGTHLTAYGGGGGDGGGGGGGGSLSAGGSGSGGGGNGGAPSAGPIGFGVGGGVGGGHGRENAGGGGGGGGVGHTTGSSNGGNGGSSVFGGGGGGGASYEVGSSNGGKGGDSVYGGGGGGGSGRGTGGAGGLSKFGGNGGNGASGNGAGQNGSQPGGGGGGSAGAPAGNGGAGMVIVTVF